MGQSLHGSLTHVPRHELDCSPVSRSQLTAIFDRVLTALLGVPSNVYCEFIGRILWLDDRIGEDLHALK